MDGKRRTGLALAAAAAVLWLVFVVMVLATPAGQGATIGAGLIGLLAVPLSVASLVLLLVSVRSSTAAAGRRGRDARIGAPLAVVSLVLFAVSWVLSGSAESLSTETALLAALGGAVLTFLAAAGLFVPSRSSRR
ncbi:hypothetical protein DQ244_11440 [Blastococcus sp. TBT05-19]|uniref:hypothetical protein n=1 Tax=Blastococcus sp. TBT05-19 TaxID=2250581 RepID=UPI000DEB1F2B|nr:hypothetical protein [Blastococcus sp. TBT05-19]RBY90086.1 hypothetical protein DQ244_11440 [Blastococcus sp. TBT05-19]